MSISDKSPIEKTYSEDALKFILENCFRSGFGTLNKTEIDLILFTAIIKYSDQKKITDHALSKYLQITQARIRNMKEKVSVKYMTLSSDEAIEVFLSKLANAKIDEKYIDVPVYDVAVKNEIEALMDENNILLHTQLNPKIFRLRMDDYLDFAFMLELESDPSKNDEIIKEKVLDEVKKKIKDNESALNKLGLDETAVKNLSMKTLKEGLIKGGMAFGIDLLASLIPGGAFASEPAKKMLLSISDKV